MKAKKIILVSLIIGLICYTPLQLYIWFGPKDGNPIGLGLLFFVGVPAAAISLALGFLKLVIEILTDKK